MNDLLTWIEAHPGLAGYIQALGSFFALLVAIGIPIWQRRAVEHAAELALHPMLDECYRALSAVQDLFPDDSRDPEFDVPGPDKDPVKVAQELARAALRLDRVSLYEFRPQCAALVRELQRQMSLVAAHVKAHVEGAEDAMGFDMSQLGEHEDSIYRLMLQILDLTHDFRDKPVLAARLRHELDLTGRQNAASTPGL